MPNLLEILPKLDDLDKMAILRAKYFVEKGGFASQYSHRAFTVEDALLDAHKALNFLDQEYRHYNLTREPSSENYRATEKIKQYLAEKGVS